MRFLWVPFLFPVSLKVPLFDLIFYCCSHLSSLGLNFSGEAEKQKGMQIPLYLRKSGWPVNSSFIIIEITVSKALSKAEGKVFPLHIWSVNKAHSSPFGNNEMQYSHSVGDFCSDLFTQTFKWRLRILQ